MGAKFGLHPQNKLPVDESRATLAADANNKLFEGQLWGDSSDLVRCEVDSTTATVTDQDAIANFDELAIATFGEEGQSGNSSGFWLLDQKDLRIGMTLESGKLSRLPSSAQCICLRDISAGREFGCRGETHLGSITPHRWDREPEVQGRRLQYLSCHAACHRLVSEGGNFSEKVGTKIDSGLAGRFCDDSLAFDGDQVWIVILAGLLLIKQELEPCI